MTEGSGGIPTMKASELNPLIQQAYDRGEREFVIPVGVVEIDEPLKFPGPNFGIRGTLNPGTDL